jgi:hypothetical protein
LTGRYKVFTQKTFDFKADFPWITGVICGPGKITVKEGLSLSLGGADVNVFPSTKEEDELLLEMLEYDVENPPLYSLIVFNCRSYSANAVYKGIEYRTIDTPIIGIKKEKALTMHSRRGRQIHNQLH